MLQNTSGSKNLRLTHVKTHNIKDITVDIPLHKWTTVTGVSGSGKSSLVFHTIYALAQRRFLETMGTYERQFLQSLPQPAVDQVFHLPPAIALKQQNRSTSRRVVLWQTAELIQPFRNVVLACIEPTCSDCGTIFANSQTGNIQKWDIRLLHSQHTLAHKEKVYIFAKYQWDNGISQSTIAVLKQQGLTKLYGLGTFLDITVEKEAATFLQSPQDFVLVLDIFLWNGEQNTANIESWFVDIQTRLDSALYKTNLSGHILYASIGLANGQTLAVMGKTNYCFTCQDLTNQVQSIDLDWNKGSGCCPTCLGLGETPEIHWNAVVPDPSLSLEEGAIAPWAKPFWGKYQRNMLVWAKANHIDIYCAWEELPLEHKQQILHSRDYHSPAVFFEQLALEKSPDMSVRFVLFKYRKYVPCGTCGQTFYKPSLGKLPLLDTDLASVIGYTVAELIVFLEKLGVEKQSCLVDVQPLWAEMCHKLDTMAQLGLGHMQLNRQSRTLSGGEYQRTLLSRILGNGISDCLYILDEPSIGLGKAETEQLAMCIRNLVAKNNTVIMVEHDTSLIQASDYIIEMGPGGGSKGGYLLDSKPSKSLWCLQTEALPALPVRKDWSIYKSKMNGLPTIQNILPTIQNPAGFSLNSFMGFHGKPTSIFCKMGSLNVVTGPSGSGKSTLLKYGLLPALEASFGMAGDHSGVSDSGSDISNHSMNHSLGNVSGSLLWHGLDNISSVQDVFELVSLDQDSMHSSISSIPATILGFMDTLRNFFAKHAVSQGYIEVVDKKRKKSKLEKDRAELLNITKMLGYGDFVDPSLFSFNSIGKCVECKGRGFIEDNLFYLGSVEKVCEFCQGKRFGPKTLSYTYQGYTIADILDQPMEDLLEYKLPLGTSFTAMIQLIKKLDIGHIPFGIPSSQLSGGELQRLKIASKLLNTKTSKKNKDKKLLCILDEPTKGLSEKNVAQLLTCLLELTEQGHTFVVVEHHPLFVAHGHNIAHMGPGSGSLGGQVIKQSTVV
jgi:excinuclease ABC subunit A